MSKPGRLAVVEVGSKGIRLLVAERRDLPEGMEVLRSLGDRGFLGEGLEQNQGRMRRGNIERSLGLVRKFLGMTESFDPERVELVGTEVFRRAANVDEFRAGLPRGRMLRVLRPEEEAAGSFLAACWGFRHALPKGGRLVLIPIDPRRFGGPADLCHGCGQFIISWRGMIKPSRHGRLFFSRSTFEAA